MKTLVKLLLAVLSATLSLAYSAESVMPTWQPLDPSMTGVRAVKKMLGVSGTANEMQYTCFIGTYDPLELAKINPQTLTPEQLRDSRQINPVFAGLQQLSKDGRLVTNHYIFLIHRKVSNGEEGFLHSVKVIQNISYEFVVETSASTRLPNPQPDRFGDSCAQNLANAPDLMGEALRVLYEVKE